MLVVIYRILRYANQTKLQIGGSIKKDSIPQQKDGIPLFDLLFHFRTQNQLFRLIIHLTDVYSRHNLLP
jgi:hypothetical protein